ncbi:hypothetical protein EON65_21725 [archaeon]|nr:MAG: hypothetical protein EON65_21725 [archaeon]
MVQTIVGLSSSVQYNAVGDGDNARYVKLTEPRGIWQESNSHIYIADMGSERIRIVNSLTNIIQTFAGGGNLTSDFIAATRAAINGTWGITGDTAGNIYYSEYNACRIRRIAPAGIVTTYAGQLNMCISSNAGATGSSATLNGPSALLFDSSTGNLYFVETKAHRVRYFDLLGSLNNFAGKVEGGFSGDGGGSTSAQLLWPFSISLDNDRNMFIADSGNCRIRRISVQTNIITTVAGNSSIIIIF